MSKITRLRCNKCGEVKPISEFRKYRQLSNGRGYCCTLCNRAAARAYYYEHKVTYIERASEWKKKNPEKYRQIAKNCRTKYKEKNNFYSWTYKVKNKDKIKVWRKKWLDGYREKALENTQRWRKSNPEKAHEWKRLHPEMVVVHTQNRNAKVRGNGGTFTVKEWETLCSFYGGRCLCCGKSNLKLTVDHVIPVSLGGKNSIDNIQPLCQSCNSKKGIKDIDYRQRLYAHEKLTTI